MNIAVITDPKLNPNERALKTVTIMFSKLVLLYFLFHSCTPLVNALYTLRLHTAIQNECSQPLYFIIIVRFFEELQNTDFSPSLFAKSTIILMNVYGYNVYIVYVCSRKALRIIIATESHQYTTHVTFFDGLVMFHK